MSRRETNTEQTESQRECDSGGTGNRASELYGETFYATVNGARYNTAAVAAMSNEQKEIN